MLHNFVPEKKKRQSDGQWRSGVFLSTSVVATALSAFTVTFMLTDGSLSNYEIDDLRLLTPLTGYEALLCALCFTPILLVLGVYVLFGRTQGNNINPHAD
jgi:hypothetical protein